ncbi:hypothetical protein MTO96_033049 [Rhipicephalus appendiculatus]
MAAGKAISTFTSQTAVAPAKSTTSSKFGARLADNSASSSRPLFNHTRRQYKPYIGDVGDGCFNSNDCRKRLCCVLLADGASCQRRPNTGGHCSDGQVKGGRYDGQCPCLKKKDECMNGVCVTKSRRWSLEE